MTDPMELALERLYAMDAGQPLPGALSGLTLQGVMAASRRRAAIGRKNIATAIAAAVAVLAIGLGPRVLHGTGTPAGNTHRATPCIQTPSPSASTPGVK